MSTSQQQLVCDNSTLTNFKQWASAISGFFTTATWTQSTDTGQVNWGTIASVPGSSAYVYEIWQPNDGLTTFYVKIEYGNFSGTNSPDVRITLSTTTNGSGTPTGFVLGPLYMHFNALTPPSTTTQYECDFSGAAGRIGAIMWRNGGTAAPGMFAIERSLNSSGAYTSTHVTLVMGGIPNGGNAAWPVFSQQTLVFGVGAGPTVVKSSSGVSLPALSVRCGMFAGLTSSAFNGLIPFDTVAPQVGFFDYPMTMVGAAGGLDIVEGVPFTVTLYGSIRTYMPTKAGWMAQFWGVNNSSGAICLRYD